MTCNVTFESAQLCLFLAGFVESRFFEPLSERKWIKKIEGNFFLILFLKVQKLDSNNQKAQKIGTPLYNVSL